MTDTGLPQVNFSESTARQRMDMGHVSQIPAVTMVTQPINTYTWQRLIMSYFASDTPVYSASETPMVEETSLHGRIWLLGSHSTPLGQPLEHGQETVPKTSLVHGEPWQLVSEDWPSGGAGWERELAADGFQHPVLVERTGSRPRVAAEIQQLGNLPHGTSPEASRHFFEAGIQWALRQFSPPYSEQSGTRGIMYDAMCPTIGVPGGPAFEANLVLPVTSVAGGLSLCDGPSHSITLGVRVMTSQPCSNGLNVSGAPSGRSVMTARQNDVNYVISSHHSGSNVQRRSPNKKVGKYDGKSSWADYLMQFDIAALLNDWDESQKAMELATSLEGAARGVLAGVIPENRLNYKVLVDKLTQRFEPEGQTATYQSQLQSRSRRWKESVPELVQDISQITHKAYPAADTQTWNSLGVSSFIAALGKDGQQLFVYQKDPKHWRMQEKQH